VERKEVAVPLGAEGTSFIGASFFPFVAMHVSYLYQINVPTGANENVEFSRKFAPEVWNNGNGAEAQNGRATRAHL
jgi:hypothetical protein